MSISITGAASWEKPAPLSQPALPQPADANVIYAMIDERAVYEKAPEKVVTTPDGIRDSQFSPDSKIEALMCEIDGTIAGYAVFFTGYSTWLGRNGLYMEDLYISPAFRGKGAAKALLKTIAQYAVSRRCARLKWSVLDWNQPAIDFSIKASALCRKGSGYAIVSMGTHCSILPNKPHQPV